MKNYVIAPYDTGVAMYEATDFRVVDSEFAIAGKFERTPKVKGMFNGREIGVFTTNNGNKYLVFTDHSAREMNS